jgi:hypothetical protein
LVRLFGVRGAKPVFYEVVSARSADEHAPGEAAPAAGIYEQLNIFGRPTGIRVTLAPTPAAGSPLGHNWTLIEEHTAES